MIQAAQQYLQTCEARHAVALKNRIHNMADDKLRLKVVEASQLLTEARSNLFQLKKVVAHEEQEAKQAIQRQAAKQVASKLSDAREALPLALEALKTAVKDVINIETVLCKSGNIEAVIHEARNEL